MRTIHFFRLSLAVLSISLLGTAEVPGSGPYFSHGSWGSSGGSYGSFGSYGSSGGSWGSSGGSWGSSGGSWGSSGGSWGSSGGSWGSSGGSFVSYGSWGSSGLARIDSPHIASKPETEKYSAANIDDHIARAYFRNERDSNADAHRWADRALLELHVPEQATVFLDGQPMTLAGHRRIYFSQPLKPGATYRYAIRVSLMHNGRTLTSSGIQRLRAGDAIEIEAAIQKDGRSLSLRQAHGTLTVGDLQIDRSVPNVVRN